MKTKKKVFENLVEEQKVELEWGQELSRPPKVREMKPKMSELIDLSLKDIAEM